MRISLTIFFLLLLEPVSGQIYRPIGEANSYTLTTKDGFPGNNYVGSFEYTRSGKVYAKDFFGDLHTTGNNFIRHVPGLKNISNNTYLLVRSDSEAWLIDDALNIKIIKNDSLWKIVKPPVSKLIRLTSFSRDKRFYCIKTDGGKIIFYELKNYVWKRSGEIPLPKDFYGKSTRGFVMKDGRLVVLTSLSNGWYKVYEIDPVHSKLTYMTTLPFSYDIAFLFSLYDKNWKKKDKLIRSLKKFMARRLPNHKAITLKELSNHFISFFPDPAYLFNYKNNNYAYFTVDSGQINPGTVLFQSKSKLNGVRFNPSYPYLTVLTGSKPFRVFPYIKKYPHVYKNNHSNNIFALGQDEKGRIWAGNYQYHLSIIDDPLSPNRAPRIIRLKSQPYRFMNAALSYDGNMYLVGEFIDGGLLRYNMDGRMTQLSPHTPTGFYLYLAPRNQIVYYPSAASHSYPVYYCKVKDLKKSSIHWKMLDSTEGIAPFGMASITEDTLGRIWMGHPKKGFAVYNPATQKGITYSTQKEETPIGFISSLTDKRGTVWMGSDNHGLWYYNSYHKAPTPKNIHQIDHPLLNDVKRITSMALYKHWLILGCYNRICLLNLDSFYLQKKINLRYLNPQEAALTGYTEQNTLLVSKKDGSVWFSTSDMLYRWDIASWLHLPTYKVKVNTFLQHGDNRFKMNTQRKLKLPATFHGLDISFEYQSPDGLPRYTSTVLVQDGDRVILDQPGTKSLFRFQNLNSGSYTFYLNIFEQSGNISRYQYHFAISKYLWQNWWFWVVVVLLFLLPFVLWFNVRRRQALQEKEISQMNLVTLSNQFRPHFILNALNVIGADLRNNPEAESIMSRLGESINLIFYHVQHKRVSHSLKDEWLLINNVIQILRIMYLPELQVSVVGASVLERFQGMELPLGILEIHVENALLHGLRNKKSPPYDLFLEINEDDKNLYFIITDNGIGKEAARAIGNYKRNGVGIKNLNNIILILNKYNKNKIEISFVDLLQKGNTGTMVTIKIPKEYYFKY